MSDWYRLDRKTDELTKFDDFLDGAREFETADRTVARDTVGALKVSTIFLCIDHRFNLDVGLPVLFETMVFGEGEWDNFQCRYSTAQDARNGHKRLIAYIQAGGKPDEWQ